MPVTNTTSTQSSVDSARQIVLEQKASASGLQASEVEELAQLKQRAAQIK